MLWLLAVVHGTARSSFLVPIHSGAYILKHHTNWRVKALESLENETLEDLHYSGVVSLSESDVIRIKNLLLDQLKENLKIIASSKEERLFVLNIDFFNLVKK